MPFCILVCSSPWVKFTLVNWKSYSSLTMEPVSRKMLPCKGYYLQCWGPYFRGFCIPSAPSHFCPFFPLVPLKLAVSPLSSLLPCKVLTFSIFNLVHMMLTNFRWSPLYCISFVVEIGTSWVYFWYLIFSLYIREWKLWSRDWYSKSIKCKCGRLLKIIALFGKVRKLLLIQDEISVCAQLLINGNFRYCTFVYIVVTTVLMDHQGSELCELYSVWGITLIIHSENVSISNLPVYQLLTLQSLTNLISLCPNILEVVQKVSFKVQYHTDSALCDAG